MLCRVVWQKFTDVSEVLTASIIWAETLVNFYQTSRRYSPEDSHLRNHRRENLKSYLCIELIKLLWIHTPVDQCSIIYGSGAA
jgi:hypothetical protein